MRDFSSNLPRHSAALPKTSLEKISSEMGVKVRIPAFAGMTRMDRCCHPCEGRDPEIQSSGKMGV